MENQLSTEFKDIDVIHDIVKQEKSYTTFYCMRKYGRELSDECSYFLEHLIRDRMSKEEGFRMEVYHHQHSLRFDDCLKEIWNVGYHRDEYLEHFSSHFHYLSSKFERDLLYKVAMNFPHFKICSDVNAFSSLLKPFHLLLHYDRDNETRRFFDTFFKRNYKVHGEKLPKEITKYFREEPKALRISGTLSDEQRRIIINEAYN